MRRSTDTVLHVLPRAVTGTLGVDHRGSGEPPTRPVPLPVPPQPARPPQPLVPGTSGAVLRWAGAGAGGDGLFDRLLEDRIVFLGKEVDDAIANRITAQLLLLAADDPVADITFYVNSPGGSVTAGMAIYDTMQVISPDVATYAVGFAASMGQFLVTAGAPGKRHALAHSRMLMHQPSAGLGGTHSDIAIRAGAYADMKREVARLTARHTGRDVDTITADADRDRWFTAEQAREYGLVDEVIGEV
ncbi:ATP-dependent Clp protease proteolytic subunit [Pseudonocardia sulfidoxydans NBRC 16205]|uniref:ATP-dependent Clp protease proteolytic subunit n=1 Tax=Pseudonocardia sulfidoxydans NBRC 16205 TaxID=1223511 RepID=A0A511DHV4_9PSEU|nr:ATP-dependent Clp protease proteolytic subunit [Pseudonocardia sulfidoxydans NBRC 16205]